MNEEIYEIYEGTEPYLFISYSHQDSDQVEPIVRGLHEMGYRLWYDTGIAVGSRWPDTIAEHLVESNCVVAFISSNAVTSDYCQEELFFAMEERKPIVAVYLEETVLPPGLRMRLSSRQAIYRYRFRDDSEFLKKLTKEKYMKPSFVVKTKTSAHPGEADVYKNSNDELFNAAVEYILETHNATIVALQRNFKITYARSTRLIEEMEKLGIIGKFNGSQSREILITRSQWDAMKKK